MTRSWGEVLNDCRDRRVMTLFFLGFSAGLPLLLVFSTLSIWLTEAGMARADITFLSWAGLAYGFKFVWAPLIDRIPAPLLARFLGRRRGWLIAAQAAIMASLVGMALTDPAHNPVLMASLAVALGFSSATQDIVIDAYRIELGDPDIQALLASSYMCGYRTAMILAGAGALELAGLFDVVEGYSYGAWRLTYLIMASAMLVGVATTLTIREPAASANMAENTYTTGDHARFFGVFVLSAAAFVAAFVGVGNVTATLADGGPLAGFVLESARFLIALAAAAVTGHCLLLVGAASRTLAIEAYVDPVREFVVRWGRVAVVILALIAVYRIADIVMGVIANVFYVELGFEKQTIGRISKVFGLIMTIVGSFVGGVLALRYGVLRILMLGAFLAAATNVLFALLATIGADVRVLVAVIAADNLSGGLASAAFVAYLSALVNVRFTATQYALFTSLMVLLPKLIAGYSGTMVDAVGYEAFFIATALLGLPVMGLVALAARLALIQK